jgi:hypothetical protein
LRLKRIIIFIKKLRKKLKIKTMRIKLENILPIQRIRFILKNIIFGKLRLKDEIINK